MRSHPRRFSLIVLLIGALVASVAPAATAQSRAPQRPRVDVPHIDGDRTVPVYSYADAIRESVDVQTEVDSDRDGELDTVRADIIRPREADEAGVDVPVIMVASPYYQCCGRGHESELKVYGPDGVPTKFPLFYDNYFVPRGYAVVQVDLLGTANSLGCMDVGGPAEIAGPKAVIDWLNGRAPAWDLDGDPVTADWSDGQVGMIGKSWDGSVANGVAATGVEGLETIVPIAAISSWYDYMRQNGTLQSTGYWNYLHGYVNGRPAAACAALRAEAIPASDDATGSYNAFWAERDYVPDADKVKASVFVVHGVGDSNVDTMNAGKWWDALQRERVPLKMWFYQTGHEEPFDVRRAEWVDTIHRWFDYWLQDIDNGIMREPLSTVEPSPGEWLDEDTWPARGARGVKLTMSGPADSGEGSLALQGPRSRETVSVGTGGNQALMWSTSELRRDVRLSGTPEVHLRIQVDRPTTAVRIRLFELGDVEVARTTVADLPTESCWGESTPEDDACYTDTYVPVNTTTTTKQLTFANASAAHWKSLEFLSPLEPGKWYDLSFPLNTLDAFVKAGNRLAMDLRLGSPGYSALPWQGATLTLDYSHSWLELPVAGDLSGLAPHGRRPRVAVPAPSQASLAELVRDFR